MRFFDKIPHIDFMKFKELALAISWGITLLCLAYIFAPMLKNQAPHVKLGMQFVGGIDMQVRYQGDVRQDVVRAALARSGFSDAAVVKYESANENFSEYSIKVKARKDQDAKDSTAQMQQITGILKTLDPTAAGDKRRDLNTEPALSLTDQWIEQNPLGVEGDVTAKRMVYEPLVSKITHAREVQGLISSYDQLPKDVPTALTDLVKKEYRLGRLSILKNESFSPSISGEWTRKTLTAVAWALGAILLYVMFRFTWSFAVAGIVALIHDILMAVGLFTVLGFEYSVPVVASFLILIGYSMSDTIVVFDRIRENLRKPEYRRVSIKQVVNDSINQTISRTLLTSVTTLLVALCLFIWGGPALRDLSFPLVIGIITGTYSSIFIASPVLVYWDRWFGGKDRMRHT